MERNTGQEGEEGELRERDEKREPGKKYHLFFRDKEDKNVSGAQRQNVSRDSGCERSPCTGGGGNYKGHREVRERGQIRARQTDGRQEDERGRIE